MANVTPHLRLREASARRAVDQAISEERKLNATRREAGLSSQRLIYSASEVRAIRRELRLEHAAEVERTISHFMLGPDTTFQRMAKLAIGVHGAGHSAQNRAARDWSATIAAAEAIVRAGNRRRAEPEG